MYIILYTSILGIQIVASICSDCIYGDGDIQNDKLKSLVTTACHYGRQYVYNEEDQNHEFYKEGVDNADRSESTYQLTLFGQPSLKAKQMAKYALLSITAGKRLQYLSERKIEELLRSKAFREIWRHAMGQQCDVTDMPICDAGALYRSMDGSCNNLKHPEWGMANRAQARYLPADYDDGYDSPRYVGKNGQPLPSARRVSNVLFKPGVKPVLDNKLTVMHMSYGQFLDHDLILTPKSTGKDDANIECCSSKSKLKPRCECFPIQIPSGDEFFKNKNCMNFVRSEPAQSENCLPGPREQLNTVTSYMDASMVYGSSEEKMNELREGHGGLLKLDKCGRLPKRKTPNCFKDVPTDKCQDAGDNRVNVVPNLGATHTLWAKEHNRLAEKLSALNPTWDDNKLFFEARKIVIAEIQHITYNEYLPPVISESYMKKFNLLPKQNGYNFCYQRNIDCTVKNAFGVAAFRFGHSQIANQQAIYDDKTRKPTLVKNIEETYHRPNMVLRGKGKGYEGILVWLATVKASGSDRFFETGIRDKLFPDTKGNSFDLPALNTQRGRDHGIPGYNKWRTWCGLPRANGFSPYRGGLVDHSKEAAAALKFLYSCTDDIDLFPGGMSEKPVNGGVVGPTFACILAKQFQELKVGDRFWYENPGKTGFTIHQLNEIKKVTLSKVICDNTEIESIQPKSFIVPSTSNPITNCSKLPGINLKMWKQKCIKH